MTADYENWVFNGLHHSKLVETQFYGPNLVRDWPMAPEPFYRSIHLPNHPLPQKQRQKLQP